jgi:hypothetical protein
MREDGAAVLEVVEPSGNAGDVEGAVGVEGAVALGGCEPVEVGARQAVMRGWSSRACEAAAVLQRRDWERTPRSSSGSPWGTAAGIARGPRDRRSCSRGTSP